MSRSTIKIVRANYIHVQFCSKRADMPVLLLLARSSSVMVQAKTGDMLRFAAWGEASAVWQNHSNPLVLLLQAKQPCDSVLSQPDWSNLQPWKLQVGLQREVFLVDGFQAWGINWRSVPSLKTLSLRRSTWCTALPVTAKMAPLKNSMSSYHCKLLFSARDVLCSICENQVCFHFFDCKFRIWRSSALIIMIVSPSTRFESQSWFSNDGFESAVWNPHRIWISPTTQTNTHFCGKPALSHLTNQLPYIRSLHPHSRPGQYN